MLAPFMRCRLWVCFLLIASVTVSSARADSSWHAPAGCPDQDDAEDQLRALGADPALLRHGDARVFIDNAPSGERRARVSLRHGERREQRVLYDRSCAALVEAAMLVISLSFEGERAQPADPLALPDEPGAWSRRLAYAGLVRLDEGSLPRPTVGVGGSLRLDLASLRAELEGAVYLWREREQDGMRGLFGLAAGAARACFVPTWPVIAPCAAVEVGQADGRAQSLSHRHARGLWGAALVGVSVSLWPARRVAPIAELELGIPFKRPAFDIEGAGTVFQARSLLVRASLRLAFELLSRP
jgi:hypothetical protein